MKLSCSSWSFHRTFEKGNINQLEWIEKCAKDLMLDGIELLDGHFPSTERAYLHNLKKFTTDLGLTIACVSVSNNFGKDTEEKRKKEVKKVKQWVDIAYYLGAPVLRIFSGWPEGEKSQLWPEMINCLKESVEYAKEAGIVSGLENHNHHAFTTSVDDLLRILKEVDSEWLKVTLDTGDYIVETGKLNGYPAVERVVSLAVFVHAKLYELDQKGEDHKQDYDKIFEIFNKAHYRGFISVEYEGEEDELLAVPRGVKFLKRYIK